MNDIYLVNTDDALGLLTKLKQIDKNHNYHIMASNDAEYICNYSKEKEEAYKKYISIDDHLIKAKIQACKRLIKLRYMEFNFNNNSYSTDNFFSDESLSSLVMELIQSIDALPFNNVLQEISQKEEQFWQKIRKDETHLQKQLKEFDKFILNSLEAPNKFSDEEIENLCKNLYKEFLFPNMKKSSKLQKIPSIKIIKLGSKEIQELRQTNYLPVFEDYVSKLEKSLNCSYVPDTYSKYWNVLAQSLDIPLCSLGGTFVLFAYIEPRIFFQSQISGLKPKNEMEQKFLNWWEQSLNVLGIYYSRRTNTFHVIKKPDELKIDLAEKEVYFRYGDEEFYYNNKASLPVWLYKTPEKDLKIDDFLLLQNADAKAVFIRKFGLERLVKFGIVVDSYENYPDNEMWAKSEYKIIDMHKVIPPKRLVDRFGNLQDKQKSFKYAPFLYMKNQTTGEYHLEGLHPRCKTLYNALKMRYNGLNINNYEIKDIR